MRSVVALTSCILLLASPVVCRAIESQLRCAGDRCDFVLSGGAGENRSLLLQPNDGDPRSGFIKLNGFAELFPDWRPSAKPGIDRLFSFAPKATLADGAVMRIFDIAPDLTVRDIVGGTLFSVTGSLTRTGSSNPLYQWTGFFTGTRFRSAASAICIGGAKARAACTTDADCPDSVCEGGSPLYQDAFFDGSIGEQLRGRAIQHTWIPISFLSKPQLRAMRTCDGGGKVDAPCTSDAQCADGGTCRGAYLDQDEFYAVYARPSFQEFDGATLINRDYAAFVLDDPYVAGAPQIDRYTGLLCDPDNTGWSKLPAETRRYCVASLSPRIKSRHAGPFRVGDAKEPTEALEVHGTIVVDTDAAGATAAADASSAGAEVVRVASGATGEASLRMFERTVQSGGADAVTLHAFAPEPGRSYVVEARVVARCRDGAGCDGESGAWVRRMLVRNAGGTVKCVAASAPGGDYAASEVDGWDASFRCAGSELQLRVKGDAGRSVTWQDTLLVQAVK
ncbi:MAG: hypothetical protein U0842_20615 [Candidatus Binatia bacterium]